MVAGLGAYRANAIATEVMLWQRMAVAYCGCSIIMANLYSPRLLMLTNRKW